MKRLLDESTDELTRSLLQAGVEHRPPPGNERQLIVAMGAGGALGLFSSNAFAWLGTTAGKVTAAGVAVGVAGAVFVAGPMLRSAEPSPAPRQAISAARPSVDRSPDVVGTPAPPSAPALAERDEPVVPEATPNERDLAKEAALSAEADEAPRRAVPERRASRAQKQSQEKKASGRQARASLQKKKGAVRKREDAQASTQTQPAAATVASRQEPVADERRAALDAEVRLVDDMHGAARRKERAALARLVAAYRAEFPDGQLKKEVADFERSLSLEPSDSPGTVSP